VGSFDQIFDDRGFTVIRFVDLFVLCCGTSVMKPAAILLGNDSEDERVTALVDGR
jgi:hypothetical protein